jgi:hypothetical protein
MPTAMLAAIVTTSCHHEPDSHQSPARVFMAGSYIIAVASQELQGNLSLAGGVNK